MGESARTAERDAAVSGGLTVLATNHAHSWREWLSAEGGSVINLDPADASQGVPARAWATAEGRPAGWRFVGSTDPSRNPAGLMAACWSLLRGREEGATLVLFDMGRSPTLRQVALDLVQSLRPERVLVPRSSGLHELGWPVGAEEVELPEEFPPMVLEAQRRARWLEALEKCETHEVDLLSLTMTGARLGSGSRMVIPGWEGWAEVSGGTLLLVGEGDPSDEQASQWLDHAHASRLSVVRPQGYENLVCSFADQGGEDFGIGFVREFAPERSVMRIECTAVSPAPVRLLRLGTLKIDPQGREVEDVRPWSL